MHIDLTLVGLALITALGVGAQWLAWRLRVPSILLLLLFGFAVGNLGDLVQPDELFGDLLFPVVSLSVAIILFEGGLSLKYSEVKEVGSVVLSLVSLGAIVTWLVAALGGWALLGFDPALAILFGAILIVTGPTVIVPLLQLIRPLRPVGPILKWEGIVIDPIGAMVTVLVFEAILIGGITGGVTVALTGPLRTILAGGVIGGLAAWLLAGLLRRFMIPDFLQNPVALTFVVAAFALSNTIQEESGLFAAPLMGMILANTKRLTVRHIIEFQENVRVLLLAGLFIILGARVSFADLTRLSWRSFVFLVILIVVARPAAVAISTARSDLGWRERTFLACLAPRGVVAAAIASLYAIRLSDSLPAGISGSEAQRLVPEVFLVIVGTVAIYGIGGLPLSRLLRVAKRDEKGVLMIGAYAWAREIAKALQSEGQNVLLVDTNRSNVAAARMNGLPVYHADVLSPDALERIDLNGIGRLFAMTSNEEFNALAALHFSEVFERSELYQLPPERRTEEPDEAISQHLRGRLLFGPNMSFLQLTARFVAGAQIWKTPITDRFTYEDFKRIHGPSAVPLLLINESGNLVVFTTDNRPNPRPGQILISLVEPQQPRSATETGRSEAMRR